MKVKTNNMSDLEKTLFTFVAATITGIALGMILWLIITIFIGVSVPAFALCLAAGLSYTLGAGYNDNGELENAIGGLFGQLTSWVIPTGKSWWVPPPFGKVLQKLSIAKETIDRTKTTGNTVRDVIAHDGAPVEVGGTLTWFISDIRVAAQRKDLMTEAEALFERGIRIFALYWDSDDAAGADTALSEKKAEFSNFLKGAKDLVDRDGNKIENDMADKAKGLGIGIDDASIVDIDPPEDVVKARALQAAELGQAEQERLDIDSMRKRINELLWGKSEPTEDDMKKEPLMSVEDATRAVRAARGELEDINVSGTAGDFTKGNAVSRRQPKKRGND